MNIVEHLKQYCNKSMITESIRNRDIDKAIKLMKSYLLKCGVYPYNYVMPLSKDGKTSFGIIAWNEQNKGVCFVWTRDDSARIDSLLFTNNFDEMVVTWTSKGSNKFKWDVAVDCKGANLVKICHLVDGVMNGKIAMNSAAINKDLADAQLFESEDEKETTFNLVIEASDDPVIDKLKKQKQALYMKIRSWNRKGKNTEELQTQYDDLAKQINDAKLAVRNNVTTTLEQDPDINKLDDFFEEEERATPEERFEDMEYYIGSVINGIKPLAVICGAPGVGKSYRIMQAIKKRGLEKDVDYKLIKGKETAAAFYMDLHDFKNTGQLVVIDDADEVVQDPVSVNLIKAACDSSDERWVSYGTSRPPEMAEDVAAQCDDAELGPHDKWYYPKQFLMESGVIIITNFSAGQLDTAIKNRALLCDLNFTVDEVLGLVENIMPKIEPDKLSMDAKIKALEYLHELADKNAPVDISIRSFTSVAGMYASGGPEAGIKRRIREQMKLQFAKKGKKY